MDEWDFPEWQAALAALGPRAAALMGLAAAERVSGCLADERFRRHGGTRPEEVAALLGACWTALGPEGASALPLLRERADELADWSGTYLTLSLTDPFPEADEPDDFLEEAEPEGAVMLHLDALTAVTEAVSACAGGPWDGALRCLRTAATAAAPYASGLPGPGVEVRRQREDLALLRTSSPDAAATELRTRARADAAGWQRAAERLDLLHD
ncbi:hypothetical protein [Streptomyces omiyaensis]|uniref:Uncharacterized protein n=1 Tax=Streptomyces omiyaensis TaxID=68247 RepID=A0ABW7BZ51_9ACTN